ncbi:MAG: aminopeptidase P family protein [Bacteroidota bacterium]
MFSANTYQQRRQALLQQFESGILLFLGNEYVGKNYSANTYPFRQDSSFLYYFGLNQASLVGLVDVDRGESYLFGNDLSMDDIVWTGNQPSIQALGERIGVEATASVEYLAGLLEKANQQGRKIHFLPPYRLANRQKISNWLQLPLDEISAHVSIPLVQAVIAQRSIKSEEEIVEMEKALAISRVIHHRMIRHTRAGIKEAQLAGLANSIALAAEGDLAYPPIVTINGQTLHNHHYHHTLKEGQLVLADVGAEAKSIYASDITRTFPVSKTFTNKQKEIYQIVLDAEVQAIAACHPNIPYRDIHFLAAETIVAGLKDIGLMQGDVKEAVAAGAHTLFFMHGLGHMIGLDVHDMEDLGEDYVGYSEHIQRSKDFGTAYLRLGRELEAGFVLTVEPGIYFIPELIQRWEAEQKHAAFINYEQVKRYLDFGGIRIEDNVLITPTSHRTLGEPIAKSIQEVEALRAG